MSLIEFSDVEFAYSENQPLIKISHFEMKKGERVFLQGPSGSGKSTFLELISGILIPQKGQVKVLGQSMGNLSSSARDFFRADHIGSIFQSFNLIPYLNVQENIDLGIAFGKKKKLNEKSIEEERSLLVEALGLQEYLERPVTRLSVGQQQRVAVARALFGSPEIILADEPTSALDEENREKFLKLIFDLADVRGSTLVFVSHDRTIQKHFQRVVALRELNEVQR